MGVVSGRVCGAKASGMVPSQREVLRRQLASATGKKPSVSLSLFLEVNNLVIEHELACAAIFRAPAVGRGHERSTEGDRSGKAPWRESSSTCGIGFSTKCKTWW